MKSGLWPPLMWRFPATSLPSWGNLAGPGFWFRGRLLRGAGPVLISASLRWVSGRPRSDFLRLLAPVSCCDEPGAFLVLRVSKVLESRNPRALGSRGFAPPCASALPPGAVLAGWFVRMAFGQNLRVGTSRLFQDFPRDFSLARTPRITDSYRLVNWYFSVF